MGPDRPTATPLATSLATRLAAALGLLALLTLLGASVACRPQPSADLDAATKADAEAEPVLRGQQAPVIAEPPTDAQIRAQGPLLEWDAADLDHVRTLESLDDGEPRYRVDYDREHPWLGAALPQVTIVVFTDYQCPYCSRWEQTVRELLTRYPDRLRVVYRQFPLAFHKQAEPAARAALAAHAQGRFPDMHARLFDNQRQLTRADLERHAADLGLDVQRFQADLDAPWLADRVQADMAFGQSRGARGTPMSFINGRPLSGAQPIDAAEELVLEELRRAEQLLGSGVPPEWLWVTFMAAAKDEAWSQARARSNPPKPGPDTRQVVATAKLTPRRGAAKKGQRAKDPAKVELVMCGDFDCPFCKRSTATLTALEARYGSDLAVFFRHFPLPMHKDARPAHRAAIAADNQGQLWAMFELLYAEPKQRSQAELEAMAKQLQLDMKRFRKDMADPDTDARIDADIKTCSGLGVSGTPTFFINGRLLSGAQPEASFATVIDEELAGKGPPPAKP
ncbi:DSBA-like thioredoxin domain protein [Plesiocystis pacifica SIR-1]|uniref:DSBA-like thioredoxin domain protein n=1 Tax=Plesiocystis pacifica SIR-1 TaxID=391625 RepID=A6GH89_9BACT|nr:thioredoxin domain-containing protein [Plesiocystis pacifica]EDM74758.1 DSBA-like thioredoxin domain protein [Plesiocystis pacifica SIR-1]